MQGRGGDKSPPLVQGKVGFQIYTPTSTRLRHKASADYGKRATSEVEFPYPCVSNYGGGSREGGGGEPIFSADLRALFFIKVCKNTWTITVYGKRAMSELECLTCVSNYGGGSREHCPATKKRATSEVKFLYNCGSNCYWSCY